MPIMPKKANNVKTREQPKELKTKKKPKKWNARKAENIKNEKMLIKNKKIPEVAKKPHLQTTSDN